MTSSHHILIIDEVHSHLLDKLSGFHLNYQPNIDLEHLEEELQMATILIMRSKLKFTSEWIDRSPNLQFIGRLGSGMDNIDVDYAESKEIVCMNAPEGNRVAVAEQTIGMMLSLLSHINRSALQVQKSVWDRKGNQGLELNNLTVGIIGFGNVGSALAHRLRGFGCRILAYDRFISGFGNEFVQECSLEELQEEADIVSLHVPLNKYSKEMVNSKFIEKMKKPFFLLNLARGSIMNVEDIISGLESKKIRGLALDVLPNEKIDRLNKIEQKELDYLSVNEDVIITPHIAGLTKDSYKKLAEVLANKVLNWIENRPLVN